MAAPPTNSENNQGIKENKVRFFGTPKEIYKQFASIEDSEGEKAMSYEDFFRALTPYKYQKPKANKKYFETYAAQVDKIMRIADVDKEGTVTFTQFFFYVVVCQTPSKHIKTAFGKAGGEMDLDTFTKCIASHRKKSVFGQKHKMQKRQEEEFMETNRIMCKRIFAGR